MTVRRSKEAAMVVVLVICSFVLTGFARPRSEQGLIFTGFHSAINFFPSVDSRRKQNGIDTISGRFYRDATEKYRSKKSVTGGLVQHSHLWQIFRSKIAAVFIRVIVDMYCRYCSTK